MGLSETEREHLRCILQQYEEDPRVLEMDQYIQHGCVTTYQHCRNVARVSFWINRRFHVGADETALAVGALLHDFYLYDWHCAGRFQHCRGLRTLFKMHGFIHPLLARENADPAQSYAPLQEQINKAFAAIKALEERVKALEAGEASEPDPEPEEWPAWVQPTGTHDAYNTGDKVTYNDKHYTCLSDGNVWSPDAYPAGWQLVEDPEA